MIKSDFIYLDEEDMIKAGVQNMEHCINTMEKMFLLLDSGDYRMGGKKGNEHGIKVSFPQKSEFKNMPLDRPDRRFMAMPAYLGGEYNVFGIKCYGSNPENKFKNLPRSVLMMSLLDVDTGMPLSYMSANILSAMRTGAVSALGVKLLAKPDAETVTIVGPGTISKYALKGILSCRSSIRTIKIKGRSRSGITGFINEFKSQFKELEFIICDSIEAACKDSDVVFFGTTNASVYEKNPCIKREWIASQAVVISVSVLLLDEEFMSNKSKVRLIADNYAMYEEWAKGNEYPAQRNVSTLLGMGYYDLIHQGVVEQQDIINIASIIKNKEILEDKENLISIYAVGGIPLEDVAWAYECYKVAREKKIGKNLKVW